MNDPYQFPMDSSFAAPKRQHANGSDQDMISKLPEEIIGRILSILPTRDAVRTAVLSKRWTRMWELITELHFDDGASSTKQSSKSGFVEFVHSMLHHLNNSIIGSFSHSISKKYQPSTVNGWISPALGLKVEKLCFESREKLSLSFHFLSKSKRLRELELCMWDSVIKVPSLVCIPHLESMTLSGIAFRCSEKEANFNLLVLKKFEMNNCIWSSSRVTFTVPLVESISLTCCRGSQRGDVVIKFCISTQLREFSYIGDMLQENIILDPPFTTPVVAAKINVDPSRPPERLLEKELRSCRLLKQFNQVELLKFDAREVLARENSLTDLPAFERLRQLELGLINIEVLLRLLLKSPHIKTLHFEGVTAFNKELLDSAIVPNCVLSTLQVVKIARFVGHTYELCFAKLILENALVLERMSIHTRRNCSTMERVLQKLLSFKKSSKSATIELLKVDAYGCQQI